jgi:hypothetical protein
MGHVRGDQQAFTAEVEAAGFRKMEELPLLEESYFLRFARADREPGAAKE